jgi:hypothetical protein
MYAPRPIAYRDGVLVGLAEGQWFAQHEPGASCLWVPGVGLVPALGSWTDPDVLWRAKLGSVTFPVELGKLGARIRVLDVALPGTFQERTTIAGASLRGIALEPQFRFIHSLADVDQALRAGRRLGSLSLLLKRWDARYPLSQIRSVAWLACVRVDRPIAQRTGT